MARRKPTHRVVTGAAGPGEPTGPGLGLAAAFTISGVAGLVYEMVWTRYLALLVGHSAYAQVLVLAVYLGGTAVGSFLVAERSRSLARPLRGYARVEVALAVFGILFHPLYRAGEALLHGVLLPALGASPWSGVVVWGLAIALILPQAVLLGATFPLMTAGVVRRRPASSGGSVADVYLLNTLGGAAGVLLGGFALVPAVGLPGTVAAAGVLNLVAAALAVRAGPDRAADRRAPGSSPGGPAWDDPGRHVLPLLLGATFLSALASFLYEVGWIRMLALVLGSATHSFELMISAFLLGLGGGSFLVRGMIDRTRTPLRLLGAVQVAMGAAALLTLPVYGETFAGMAWLVRTLPRSDGGYLLFNLSRYGLGLLIMLPATLLAGMTLPLVAGTLLRSGRSERVIGQAYGFNTLGSVAGAVAGGLVLLPALGLEGLLAAGAAVDLAVGVALLAVAAAPGRRRMAFAGLGTAGAAVLVLGVTSLVKLDRATLTAGVFRAGALPEAGRREVLYYHDGATATVGAYRTDTGLTVLTTNGKPDASMPARWIRHAAGLPAQSGPIQGGDEATQVLAPLVLLAHRPDAKTALVIGHGSGMSAQLLLGSPTLQSLTTVEIEPAMVRGSEAFLPTNRRPFEDPRSRFALDDARGVLARQGEPVDLILSEPSNPWVSGVASLFTVQFYERVRSRLGEGGVFGQWFHLYEMEDGLLLSVLAAVDRSFPHWSAWMVGEADLLLVASNGPLPAPDWSVTELPGIRDDLSLAPPLAAASLESLRLFDRRTFGPLLQRWPANADARPLLDVGAERARFLDLVAEGLFSFADDPIDLHRTLQREPSSAPLLEPLAITRIAPMTRHALAGWLRAPASARGPAAETGWTASLARLSRFESALERDDPGVGWNEWTLDFVRVERDLHGRTAGWADTAFYAKVEGFLARAGAPAGARAAVELLGSTRRLDPLRAVDAADRVIAAGSSPLPPALLLDLVVIAYLQAGRSASARSAFDALAPRTGRPPRHARNLVLDALIRRAEDEGGR